MEGKFCVTWPANFFEVVDALSEWEKRAGNQEEHTWLQLLKLYEGRFGYTQTDDMHLGHYGLIRANPRGRLLDTAIIPEKELSVGIERARKVLKPLEFGILKKVYQHYSGNVRMLYDDSKPHLLKRMREIKDMYGKFDFDGLFSDIARFYESSGYPDVVKAHLVMNACDESHGGNICTSPLSDSDMIIFPKCPGKSDSSYTVADLRVFSHEGGHTIEDKSDREKRDKVLAMWKERGLNGMEMHLLRESILDTLVGRGVLARKYGLIKRSEIPADKELEIVSPDICKRGHYTTFRRKIRANLYGMSTRQLRRGKTAFDGNYMANAADTLIKLRPY